MKLQNKLFIIFIFTLLFGFSFTPKVFSQSATELKNKISERNKQIEKLEKEISSYKGELTNLDKEANTLVNAIKKLDVTKKKLNTDIEITGDRIETTNLTISKLSLDIKSKEELIDDGKLGIAQGIKEIDESDTKSIAEILLSGMTFSEAWNQIESLRSVHSSIKDKINELKDTKIDLENDKYEAERAKNDLVFYKDQLVDQKKLNDQNTAEKNKLLKDTKNQEANYQQLLNQKVSLKASLEKEISDYESQLKFILDPSKLPTGSVLNWPLDSVYITQMFGKTADSGRLYVSGSHNGTDFRASVGTSVKSASQGTVQGVGDTDKTCPGASYGKWVLVKHNNGLTTLYAHLSLIKVSTGQTVSSGQVLGYAGSTGYSTGPHLHFSLFASDAVKVASLPSKACGGKIYTIPLAATNAYLDPMKYLPKY